MPGKYPTALELARAAEADGNTYEARKQYKEALQQDPQNREAAFFLQCYDATELSVQDITSASGELADSFAETLAALPEGDETAVLPASMAKRVTDLADRWLRSVDYTAEHYVSSVPQDRQRMQLLTEKRREACVRMLQKTENALASHPGAEDVAHSVRKEELRLLAEHPNALPGAEVRKESARLAKLIRQREPDAAMDIPTVSRLGTKKPMIVGGLLCLSVLLYIASAWLWGQLSNATFSILIIGVFNVLLYLSIRKRDEGNKLHAVSCAAIFLATETLLFLMRMFVAGGSGFTPLSRGIANPAEILIGGALLLYALKGPFKKNWLALGMLVFGLFFVVIYMVGWNQHSTTFHQQTTAYRDSHPVDETLPQLPLYHLDSEGNVTQTLTCELLEVKASDESEVPSDKPVYLIFSKEGSSSLYYLDENETPVSLKSAIYPVKTTSTGFTTKDSICFVIDSDGEIWLISWLTGSNSSEEGEEETENKYIGFIKESDYTTGMRTFFILQLVSTFAFDLACAVGFMNPNTRGRKKKSAAGA
ncbi:MAG: tetratricopeptide repeat protein [Clostridia bacterium]|nr:tetratricopeptide repeat protein [Clostridia bacterium]